MTRKLYRNYAGLCCLVALNLVGFGSVARATTAVPYVVGVSPASAPIGGSGFTLTVSGANFTGASAVEWSASGVVTPLITTIITSDQLTAAVPASLLVSYGTAAVTVVTPGAIASNVAFFTVTNPSTFLTFRLTQQSPSGGNHPYFPVTGVFNTQVAGLPLSLAVTNDTSGSTTPPGVSVFIGNGNGSFQGAGSSTYAVGNDPQGQVIGDFNGDGIPDLASVDNQSSTISVLLGNGDGTFQNALTTSLTANSRPTLAAVADFNGDGNLDLAVVSEGFTLNNVGFVGILLGNGDGTFQPSVNYDLGSSSLETQPAGLAVADFDGNGTLDLAVTDAFNSEVWILSGNGNGTFTSPGTAYATAGTPASVVTGDFNSDGSPDLAVTYQSTAEVSVLLNSSGAFNSHTEYPTAAGGIFLAAADLNGDGILDLAVPGYQSDEVSVLLGVGDGTFDGFSSYTISPAFTSILGITAGDFNNDGRLDLAFTVGTIINTTSDIAVFLQAPLWTPSPTSLSFGDQPVGTQSTAQTITFDNNGAAPLQLDALSSTDGTDFPETNTCGPLPKTFPPGTGCTVTVTFSPGTPGNLSANISVVDNIAPPSSPQLIPLSGTGTQPAVRLSPSSLTFSNQAVGTTSPTQTVTLTNTGNGTLMITSIAASGDFAETNTCGSSLIAGAHCTISVTFKPTAAGTRTGSVSVSDNAPGSPQTVSLTGTGTAPAATLNPSSLTFALQMANTTSVAQVETLTNTGTANLTISSIAASANFGQTNTCTSPIAPSGNCTISVTFTPTASGVLNGTVTITDNASPTTQTVSLTGTGGALSATATPGSLSFGNELVGTGTASQNVTLTNTGTVGMNVTIPAASGDFTDTNTCGTSLAASATCTISVSFKPTATGTRTGTLTITDTNSSGSGSTSTTETVSLTGTGTQPAVSLSTTSLAFSMSQILNTTSAVQPVTLTNTGTATLNLTSITPSGQFNAPASGSTCAAGGTVAAGASCTINVTFTPTTGGSLTGSVTLTDNASPTTQTIGLSGTGAVLAALASPGSLTFSGQLLNTSSAAQKVTLTNTGTVGFNITSLAATGDFSETNTCGSSLAASAACTISITFKPTASGTRTGTVTVSDTNNSGSGSATSTETITLSGTGTEPVASLSSLTQFASQLVGTSSAAETVTVSNTGSAALTITSVAISGTNASDYAETNTCSAAVAAAGTCTINVTFTPSATGVRDGTLTVTDNNDGTSGSTQALTLTGTGTAPAVTLSPASLTFANQNVGTTSAAENVTVTNSGTATLTLSTISASGDFSQTSTCGNSLAAGAKCTISVTFKPSALFTRTGALTLTDNGSADTQTVALTGTGMGAQATLSASSLTFAGELMGVTSAARTVTVTNSGNASMTVTSLAATGDFAQTSTCGSTLAANASCTISVTFKASAAGVHSGDLTLTNSGVGSPQAVALSGTGQDFGLTGSGAATVTPGQTASYTVTLTPEDGLDQAISLACSGAPSEAACGLSSSSVTSAGATSIKVTVTTAAPSSVVPFSRSLPPLGGNLRWVLLGLVGLVGTMLLARPKSESFRLRPALVGIAMLVILALGMAACGGGSNSQVGNSNPGTAAGTYSLTVTGTATSGSVTVSHDVVLTLTVQ
jgi:hypothetical protein